MFEFIKTWMKHKEDLNRSNLIKSEYDKLLDDIKNGRRFRTSSVNCSASGVNYLIKMLDFMEVNNIDTIDDINNMIRKDISHEWLDFGIVLRFQESRIEDLNRLILYFDEIEDILRNRSEFNELFEEVKAYKNTLIEIFKVHDEYNKLLINKEFKLAAEYAVKFGCYEEAFEMYKKIGDIDNAYKCKVIMMD